MLRNPSTTMASILALLVVSTATSRADTVGLDAATIKAGLRTAAPEEDGFVDRVLQAVEEGRLSAGLVRGMFLRARKRPEHRFQQFKRGLLTQVSDPGLRSELVTGQSATEDPPPTFGQTLASRVRRLFSFLPSVHAMLK
ncbi:MAG: hypothetical protein ABIK89_15270 [Planctomycetota bacterium]